jgi:hypothetical protein
VYEAGHLARVGRGCETGGKRRGPEQAGGAAWPGWEGARFLAQDAPFQRKTRQRAVAAWAQRRAGRRVAPAARARRGEQQVRELAPEGQRSTLTGPGFEPGRPGWED